MTSTAQTLSNAAQIEYWNSATGEAWAREQVRLDRAFEPLTAALVAAADPRPGERVVEIGCGCGELSLILSERVGVAGKVVAFDISRPMLDLARRRERQRGSGAAGSVEWREEDASTAALEAVHDLLVSRFGTMFFADPTAAFAHLRSGLKPAGRLAMLCWREVVLNGWASVPIGAVAARFGPPEPTPPFAPGPFAFADHDRTIGLLRQAGWRDLDARPVDASMRIGVAEGEVPALEDAVHYAMTVGPVARYLRDRPDLVEEARDVVRASLAPHQAGDVVALPGACWLYSGRAG